MSITRLNLYAGLVGFYLIRDELEDSLHLPSGDYEIPLMLYDRSLTASCASLLSGFDGTSSIPG